MPAPSLPWPPPGGGFALLRWLGQFLLRWVLLACEVGAGFAQSDPLARAAGHLSMKSWSGSWVLHGPPPVFVQFGQRPGVLFLCQHMVEASKDVCME